MASTTSSDLRFRHLASTLIGAAAIFLSVNVWAQSSPSAADLATARELFFQAKDMRAAGDLKGALERYRGAWATAPTPIIGLELGRTHVQLGELIEAREVLLAVGRLKVEPDETRWSAQARQEASAVADELRPKIATLVIKLEGVPEGSTPSVAIDGANVAVVGGGTTRKINPGKHEIVARAGAAERRDAVELAAGETKEISLNVTSDAPIVATQPAAHADGMVSAETSSGSLRTTLIIGGFGLAGAGVVVGTVTGVLALGKSSSVKSACPERVCPESARPDLNQGRTFATVSTIGFGAAAVGAVAGLVGLLVLRPSSATSARPEKSASVMPTALFTAESALLGAHGRF